MSVILLIFSHRPHTKESKCICLIEINCDHNQTCSELRSLFLSVVLFCMLASSNLASS